MVYTIWYSKGAAKGPRMDLEASSLEHAKDLYILEVDAGAWQRQWHQLRETGIGEDEAYLALWAHLEGGEVGAPVGRAFELVRGGKWGTPQEARVAKK